MEGRNADVTSVQWLPDGAENPALNLNVQIQIVNKLETAIRWWMDDSFLYDFWIRIPNNLK